jgi:DNA repair protein RadC
MDKSIEYSLKSKKHKFPTAKITSPENIYEYARNFYGSDIDIYESFFLIVMNNANETTGFAKISQGGIVETAVDVRLISKYAIDALAMSIAVVHNHPSGNLRPSEADKKVTKKIQAAMDVFGIRFLDSVIISRDGYYSFSDAGLM